MTPRVIPGGVKSSLVSLETFKLKTAQCLNRLLKSESDQGLKLVTKHKEEAQNLWETTRRNGFMVKRYADQFATNLAHWILDQEGLKP
jgi:hypothetical protein